jgi:sulfoxide reductase catalytic subunit YedY
MKRRDFLKTAAAFTGGSILPRSASASEEVHISHPADDRPVSNVAFPQKRPLITYSDRPPLLETPREVFANPITPNDMFFVRWHMPLIPTYIDKEEFRLVIEGEVKAKTEISLHSLKNDFEPVEITAVMQCGGNGRSAFKPTPGGIQWGIGAMGCAKWKGARLKDVLAKAGLKPSARWLALDGMEKAVYNQTDDFIRALALHDVHDDIIIAYEMNGEALPYLNGYPVRLVIPGTYADSWMKMLSRITVYAKKPQLHFMEHAYRIPDNACECETPENLYPKTKPIEKMNVNSVIGYPTSGTKVGVGSEVIVRGVAFDGGEGIAKVEISLDKGETWKQAELDEGKAGKYAYRAFRYAFTPQQAGTISIMARATNVKGEMQPFAHEVKWNRGGYKFNGIDEVTIEAVNV